MTTLGPSLPISPPLNDREAYLTMSSTSTPNHLDGRGRIISSAERMGYDISPQPTVSIGSSGSTYLQHPYQPPPPHHHPSYPQHTSSPSHYPAGEPYPSPVSAQYYSAAKYASPSPSHHSPSPSKFSQQQNQVQPAYNGEWGQQAGPSTYRRPSGSERRREERPVEHEDGRVGVDDPFGERSYTEVKCLGDGSFGTVWLCDWHSPVRAQTYLSAMQCGAGARPEWSGKKLVALKRMKRVWEGGWGEAKNLGELASLRLIPPHDNIIPLYDAFISPKSRELYFVFECMEGNLYQLTKSRRGRPLAAGLVASCFHQISAGLHHIHLHGYFHRDMKPENLLVTTTGLTDYLTAATLNTINARGTEEVEMRYEKDVSVIVKLADFGLARATNSKPPYTEYVSTRWYRAPEVLLRSREYGPPVDMWALGTILAEMVNLKPLFPGVSEIDQVFRICGTMGDPSSEYGHDERGRTIGGGSWNTGIKLAKNVGFSFPKLKPVHFRGLFSENVPQSLIDCISDLLRYNPRYRLTSAECIEHPYFHETLPHLRQTPPIPRVPFSKGQPAPGALRQPAPNLTAPPRQIPPSHSHQAMPQPPTRPAFADGDMRILPPPISTPDHGSRSGSGRLFFPPHGEADGRVFGASALVNQLRELDLPTEDLASYGDRPPPLAGDKRWQESHPAYATPDGSSASARQHTPSMSGLNISDQPRTRPTRPSRDEVAQYVERQNQYDTDPRRAGSQVPPPIVPIESAPVYMPPPPAPVGAVSKKKKWGLSSVFGSSEKHLPPVDEHTGYAGSSLKRTQSGNQPRPVDPATILDPKKAKKEAERQAREVEKQKREAAVERQKERARAVMQKREGAVKQGQDFELNASSSFEPSKLTNVNNLGVGSSANLGQTASGSRASLALPHPAGQSAVSVHSHESGGSQSVSIAALAQRDRMEMERDPLYGARHKARRRDDDLDHSRSSLDINSLKSRSALTIGTIDSDPGPRRNFDPIHEGQSRRHASHSLNKPGSRSASKSRLMSISNLSQDSQLANDFRVHANVGSSSSTSLGRHGQSSMSLHGQSALSLHDLPPVPTQYLHHHGSTEMFSQTQGSAPTSPYGHPTGTAVAMGQGIGRDYVQQGLPPINDWEGQGLINPMFRVPPQQGQRAGQTNTLPPFAALASVADKQRPPPHP